MLIGVLALVAGAHEISEGALGARGRRRPRAIRSHRQQGHAPTATVPDPYQRSTRHHAPGVPAVADASDQRQGCASIARDHEPRHHAVCTHLLYRPSECRLRQWLWGAVASCFCGLSRCRTATRITRLPRNALARGLRRVGVDLRRSVRSAPEAQRNPDGARGHCRGGRASPRYVLAAPDPSSRPSHECAL